ARRARSGPCTGTRRCAAAATTCADRVVARRAAAAAPRRGRAAGDRAAAAGSKQQAKRAEGSLAREDAHISPASSSSGRGPLLRPRRTPSYLCLCARGWARKRFASNLPLVTFLLAGRGAVRTLFFAMAQFFLQAMPLM